MSDLLDLLLLLQRADNRQFWVSVGVRVVGNRAVLFRRATGTVVSVELDEGDVRHLATHLGYAIPTDWCVWHGADEKSRWASETDCTCHADLVEHLQAAITKIHENGGTA